MEEKKLKPRSKAKESAPVQDNRAEQKMSYEELNDVCIQLYQQNQNLIKQLQRTENVAMFKRLDYLFKVVEFADVFGDPDFVGECMDELKEALTVSEDRENTDVEEN